MPLNLDDEPSFVVHIADSSSKFSGIAENSSLRLDQLSDVLGGMRIEKRGIGDRPYPPSPVGYMVDATKLILENIVLFIVCLAAARVLSKATILKRNSKKTHGSDNPVSASATDAQRMKLGK
ncbi:hypothetical protein C3L33_08013, partial [Rhododendron williamsianum]